MHDATVEAIAKLAQEADGGYREDTLKLAEPVVGLPDQVSILVREGPNPKAESLRPLFEEYRTAPERRTGTATVTTLASFIDLTNRHKDEHSAVFAETAWPNPKLTAVLDYHQLDGAARFGKHRIAYAFPLTDEFRAWIDGNGKGMAQADFAAFMEDRAAELAAPYEAEVIEFERLFKTTFATPSQMIELSRGLQVHVNSTVKNHTMLQSGEVEIAFREEHRDAAGEKITVPGVFMVAVPAWVDGQRVRLPARLRYRVREGKVVWSYQLYRWEYWLRVQVSDDLATVRKQTELPTFEGKPEA